LRLREAFEVLRKLGPAQETVRARDHELRAIEPAAGHALAHEAFDLAVHGIVQPARDPFAYPLRPARSARLDEIFRLLPVLFEIGVRRKRTDVLRVRVHTNLLSSHAWSPHGQA